MKKVFFISILIISSTLFSCKSNPSTNHDKLSSDQRMIQIDSSAFSFSDFYNNRQAKLLFFNLNFKLEKIQQQNSLHITAKLPLNEIGVGFIPIGGWISSSVTNDDDQWNFTFNSFNQNQFYVSGLNSEVSHSESHNLEGHVGIVLAYKEDNHTLTSTVKANCDIEYFCGKKFGSLSKHNITIDGKKYTYKVNDPDITKDKVIDYVKSVCLGGNIDIETGLSEGWEFECP